MPDIILKIVLPLIGLVIILLCIGVYIFPYGNKLKDCIQEIRLFGADMKISIITVFVMVGLIFIFAGTYFNIAIANSTLARMLEDEKKTSTSYQQKLFEMQGQIDALKKSESKTLNYFIDLDSTSEIPDPRSLKICYKLFGDEDKEKPLICSSVTSFDKQRMRITIENLTTESLITALVAEDTKTKRKWKTGNFFPLSPCLKLSPIN